MYVCIIKNWNRQHLVLDEKKAIIIWQYYMGEKKFSLKFNNLIGGKLSDVNQKVENRRQQMWCCHFVFCCFDTIRSPQLKSGRWEEKFFDPILPHHETGTRFRPWEFIHAVKTGEKDSSDKLCILLFVPIHISYWVECSGRNHYSESCTIYQKSWYVV